MERKQLIVSTILIDCMNGVLLSGRLLFNTRDGFNKRTRYRCFFSVQFTKIGTQFEIFNLSSTSLNSGWC